MASEARVGKWLANQVRERASIWRVVPNRFIFDTRVGMWPSASAFVFLKRYTRMGEKKKRKELGRKETVALLMGFGSSSKWESTSPSQTI